MIKIRSFIINNKIDKEGRANKDQISIHNKNIVIIKKRKEKKNIKIMVKKKVKNKRNKKRKRKKDIRINKV